MTSPTIADLVHLALSYVQLDRDAEAEVLAAEPLQVDPEFSAERHAYNDAFVDQGMIAHFLESARKAGLPVCATEA